MVKSRSCKYTLSLLLAASFALAPGLSLNALAKDSKANKEPKATKQTKSASKSKSVSKYKAARDANPGIDDITMSLMNRGDWAAVAERLEKLIKEDKHTEAPSMARAYRQAWLAFSYMYIGKKEKTHEVLESIHGDITKHVSAEVPSKKSNSDVKSKADQDRIDACYVIVRAMDEVALSHFDVAGRMLTKLGAQESASYADECLYNFALACVYGKKGQASKGARALEYMSQACEYSRRAYLGDGRFAWALRTIAFLQQKWLKDNAVTERVLVETLLVEPRINESRDMLVDVKLARNDFDGAIDVAQKGIKLDVKDGSAYFRLAQIYIQQWRLHEALKELDRAIVLDANNSKYFRSRGKVRMLMQDLSGAIADQTRAVELSKDKSFELIELANLHVTAGNTNKAIDSFREALAADPENTAAREKYYKLLIAEKRYSDLAAEYKEQTTRHPDNAALHLGYANILMALNEDSEAIEQFKSAAKLNPMDPAPHRALGAYYIQKRKYDLAAQEYTAALNIMPASTRDLVSLGFCYAEDDEYLKAEAAFVTVLALQQLAPSQNPDDPSRLDVMRSLASLLYDEGRYGDAAEQFRNLAITYKDRGATAEDAFLLAKSKLMRDLSDAAAKETLAVFEVLPAEKKENFRYGMIEALLDAGMPVLARQELNKVAVESRSDNLLYSLYDAACLRLEGKGKEAEEAALKAKSLADAIKVERPGQAARLYLEICRAQIAQGNYDAAQASAKEAVSIYAKSYPAHLCLAEIAIKKGDQEGALAAARKAIQLNPYYAPAYLVVGESQVKSGGKDLPEGLANLRKAIELYPGWIEGHKALLRGFQKAEMLDDAKKEQSQISMLETKAKE